MVPGLATGRKRLHKCQAQETGAVERGEMVATLGGAMRLMEAATTGWGYVAKTLTPRQKTRPQDEPSKPWMPQVALKAQTSRCCLLRQEAALLGPVKDARPWQRCAQA
jgi:hypothetical protein